jgi:site-specific DNA recombinase
MSSTKTPRRAGVYARISSDPSRDELGVRRQVKDCTELCARRGWVVVEQFVDDDRSAFNGKPRPAYQALLAALEAGQIDAVVAWHPDRLHRAPVELEHFIALVEAAGAEVATCTAGDIDLATPSGRMTARIVGAVARHESERRSARIRRKARETAENGTPNMGGQRRPYGYRADRLTVEPAEARVIQAAAGRLFAGESLRSIAAGLNQAGVPTVGGGPWDPRVLRTLLRSARMAGRREHRGQVVAEDAWPAIIDPDTHRRLRAVLDDPGRLTRRTPRRYVLSGLVFCGRCNHPMGSRPRHGYRAHVCTTSPARPAACGRCQIKAADLEQRVVKACWDAADSPAVRAGLARVDDTPSADARELDALEARRLELPAMWARGELDRAQMQAALEAIDGRLAELRSAEAAAVRAQGAAALVGDLRQRWESMTLEQQRAAVGALVARVVIAPATVKGRTGFDGSRVEIEWRH